MALSSPKTRREMFLCPPSLSLLFFKISSFHIWDFRIRDDFLLFSDLSPFTPWSTNITYISSKEDISAAIVSWIEQQMDEDRKVGALKQLQGHMWRVGYESGSISGQCVKEGRDG